MFTAILLGVVLLAAGCSTSIRREPFGLQTAEVAFRGEAFVAIHPTQKCSSSLEKRLVYGLFVLPFNRIESAEWERVRGRSIRYREEVRPADLLWSFVGFWVSIVTRTAVVEDCGPAGHLIDPGRLASLEKDSRKTQRLARENDELKRRLATMEPSTAEPVGKRSLPGTEKEPPTIGVSLPRLVVRTSDGKPLGQTEQFRFVMSFATGSTALSAESQSKLDDIVRQLGERKESRVLVIGHVEYRGDDSRKLKLAHDRARGVAEYLTGRGIPRDRLLTASMRGAGWPHSANRTNREHAMFLSVSVVVLEN